MAAWFSWRIRERPQEPRAFSAVRPEAILGSGRMARDLIVVIGASLVIAAGVMGWWQPD
jgi:hypothetical protein